MTQSVSDHRSNAPEQIEYAVQVIGASVNRRKVFEAVYRGKQQTKTVAEISTTTGLTPKQVLDAGKRLAAGIVKQTKVKGATAYSKDDFYAQNRNKILSLVKDPKRLDSIPTKRRPEIKVSVRTETIMVPKNLVDVKHLTIDDLDHFKKLKPAVNDHIRTMLEQDFKKGLQSVIGQKGDFKDWGGETADLWTTQVLYKGTRIAAAFAFKGRATKEPLTPGKMGKNGDQIQRLFKNPADLFIVQFRGKIEPSVFEQMETFAKLLSIEKTKRVYYCVIDGTDSNRVIEAYPTAFGIATP